ncbi:unnamed protein product [Mytilus coruscus]|uniref:Uncharacterized protein n=1 Tax=Mytilus coruscus TaxID=42192 RepID=A0A6J8CSR8_MYTCO|nr:unnamed protein product [Mytilus coruscus]
MNWSDNENLELIRYSDNRNLMMKSVLIFLLVSVYSCVHASPGSDFLGILAWTNEVNLETVHTDETACEFKEGTDFNLEGCINAIVDKVCSGNCNGRGRDVVSAVIWYEVIQTSAFEFCVEAEDYWGCVWLLSEPTECQEKRSFGIKKSAGSGHDLPQLPPKPSEKRSLNFDNLKNVLKSNKGGRGLLKKMLNIKK